MGRLFFYLICKLFVLFLTLCLFTIPKKEPQIFHEKFIESYHNIGYNILSAS